jgi:hypothetical protein
LLAALAILAVAACAATPDTRVAALPAPTHTMSPAAANPTPHAVGLSASGKLTTRSLTFSGLPSGTYPVHLHRICDGRQGFHLAYLPSLHITASTGTILVPVADFGRSWCVIVYANQSATAVLTTRRI